MKSKFLNSSPISLDLGLLIFRIFLAGGLLTHGYPKLLKVLSGNTQFMNPLGIGQEISLYLSTFAEFFCATLVLLGLFNRVASAIIVLNMATVFFIVHSADEFGKKELPFLYFGLFLALFLIGPGRHSLDNKIN